MADLSTTYMGVPLGNPVIVAASSISNYVDKVKKAEEIGAAKSVNVGASSSENIGNNKSVDAGKDISVTSGKKISSSAGSPPGKNRDQSGIWSDSSFPPYRYHCSIAG